MIRQLEKDPDKYGFLGATSTVATQSSANNATVALMYFRHRRGLLAYAHSPLHMASWKHFVEVSKVHPHVGVFHETFEVEPGKCENVYINMPKIGLGRSVLGDWRSLTFL
jgi:hypothetical protein